MRLVIVNHEYPPIGGGAATACQQIAESLADHDHQILVVTRSASTCDDFPTIPSMEIQRIGGGRSVLLAPGAGEILRFTTRAAMVLPRLVREFRADALLAFFAVPGGCLASRVARKLALPLVVSVRGSDVPGFSAGRLSSWTGRLARPLIRTTLQRADVVVPNSRHLHDLVLQFMPDLAAKCVVIPNGFNSDRATGNVAASNNGVLRLITVSQLIRRKRIDLLLQTVAKLRGLDIAARLTIVGSGPQQGELQRLAGELKIGAYVEFAGHQLRESLPAILHAHDVFVLMSEAEGMSNSVLEAMTHGLPIVTTENGTHDVVIEAGCGEVVPRNDVKRLTDVLSRLWRDEAARKTFSLAGLDYARRNSWSACAARFESVLLGAIANHSN